MSQAGKGKVFKIHNADDWKSRWTKCGCEVELKTLKDDMHHLSIEVRHLREALTKIIDIAPTGEAFADLAMRIFLLEQRLGNKKK